MRRELSYDELTLNLIHPKDGDIRDKEKGLDQATGKVYEESWIKMEIFNQVKREPYDQAQEKLSLDRDRAPEFEHIADNGTLYSGENLKVRLARIINDKEAQLEALYSSHMHSKGHRLDSDQLACVRLKSLATHVCQSLETTATHYPQLPWHEQLRQGQTAFRPHMEVLIMAALDLTEKERRPIEETKTQIRQMELCQGALHRFVSFHAKTASSTGSAIQPQVID